MEFIQGMGRGDMTEDRRFIKVAAVVAALCLLASACTGLAVPTASPDPSVRLATSTTTSAATPQLVVLGDGVDGGLGLWGFEAPDLWTALAPLPSATGIARFGDKVAVASGGSVELRPAG